MVRKGLAGSSPAPGTRSSGRSDPAAPRLEDPQVHLTGRTRIAPTPSGFLHLGNAVNFLITERLAQRQGARILLRIDDLDAERVRAEYVEDVFEALPWLGIQPHEGPRNGKEFQEQWSQQLRLSRYHQLAATLRSQGHLYGCVCSRRERILLQGTGRSTCTCRDQTRDLDAPDVTWRLRVPERCPVKVRSLFGADVVTDLFELMPDPVLRQRTVDGVARPAYQLASLADDVDHGTTFIVRGEDLWPSTVCQVHLAGLLSLPDFQHVRFVHHPLLLDDDGNKLSKSEGALALRAMRERGTDPAELRSMADAVLARIEGRT